MTLTLELAPEVEARLRENAARNGQDVATYLLNLALHDEPRTVAPKITAASVRGKYAVPVANVVDDFMAERRAEGLAEEIALQQAQGERRAA